MSICEYGLHRSEKWLSDPLNSRGSNKGNMVSK